MRQRLRARLDEVQLDEMRKMRAAQMCAACGIGITPTSIARGSGAKKAAEHATARELIATAWDYVVLRASVIRNIRYRSR